MKDDILDDLDMKPHQNKEKKLQDIATTGMNIMYAVRVAIPMAIFGVFIAYVIYTSISNELLATLLAIIAFIGIMFFAGMIIHTAINEGVVNFIGMVHRTRYEEDES